eukprot:SAG31_NODE_271_length_18717_cov_8.685949_11_plen_144_part_00
MKLCSCDTKTGWPAHLVMTRGQNTEAVDVSEQSSTNSETQASRAKARANTFDISSVPKPRLDELKGTFLLFDKNNDGIISPEELCDVLIFLGQKPTLEDAKVGLSKSLQKRANAEVTTNHTNGSHFAGNDLRRSPSWQREHYL